MTAEKKIEDIINQELTRMWEGGAKSERTRILSLLENEIEVCTCEEPLQHLQRRIRSIKIKGEK